ncbi:hypothetical protein [Kitasatospora terrestris]|uniref:Anaphase-promoting complex subunit 4 WD40 domain-containing protein n=1 Tax=Kitasatospora terrestris TaxID=258051 RepID=A0ABP9EID0_9ACTN
MEQAAQEWADARRDPSLLYRGIRLQAAREWAGHADGDRPSTTAAAFLAASVRNARRSVRRRRAVIAVLAVLALLASGAAVVALQQRSTAQEQQKVATVRLLMAKADAAMNSDPRSALRLDIAAHRLHGDADTYGSLQRVVSTTPYAGQLTGVDSEIRSVAYSPSGRYLAAGFQRGGVMLWDVNEPHQARQLGEPLAIPDGDGAEKVVFSVRDSRLVAADAKGAVAVWDLADPQHPSLAGTPLAADRAASSGTWFSPDGAVLARAVTATPGLQLWDLKDPAQPQPIGPPLTAYPEPVDRLAFSPDGTMMATAAGRTDKNPVLLWDVRQREAPRQVGRIVPAQPYNVHSLTFSGDGRALVVAGTFGPELWDIGNPAEPRAAGAVAQNAIGWRTVFFAPTGATMATTDDQGVGLVLWDATQIGRPRAVDLLAGGQSPSVVAFSPDGRRVAGGGGNGLVTLWNLDRVGQPRTFGPPFGGHQDELGLLESLAVSQDGKLLATGSQDNTVDLWDTADPARPRLLATLTGHTGQGVYSAAFSPDGRTLATSDTEGTVILWDLADREHPRRSESWSLGSAGPTRILMFSADGKTLMTGDWGVVLWEVGTPGLPRQIGKALQDMSLLGVWRVRDGRVLALVHGSGAPATTRSPVPRPTITVSDSEGELRLEPVDPTGIPPSPVPGVPEDPGDMNAVRLWDITDPGRAHQVGPVLFGQGSEVGGVAMSPDGDLLAGVDGKGAVILWDLTDPERARRIGDPLAPYGTSLTPPVVAVSPSGDILATGGPGGAVLLWDLGNRAQPRQLSVPLTSGTESVKGLVFSTDGRTLTAAGASGELALWDLRPAYDLRDHLDRTACLVAGGGLDREEWARYLPGTDYRDTCAA